MSQVRSLAKATNEISQRFLFGHIVRWFKLSSHGRQTPHANLSEHVKTQTQLANSQRRKRTLKRELAAWQFRVRACGVFQKAVGCVVHALPHRVDAV